MGFLRRLVGRGRQPDEPHRHIDDPAGHAGWDAISAVLDGLYGGAEPWHWGTIMRWRLGGPDPLDGVSAYRVEDPAHWHYVSYGLSELYEKESDDPSFSGWGIELTFRLARQPAEDEVPLWPVSLLQNMARYVFTSGNVLRPGDHVDAHGPIALDEQTDMRAMLFVLDPQLGTIATPNGEVGFVQVVGLTLDEYEAARAWNSDGIAELLRERSALLVTDLRRTSMLADPGVAEIVRIGIDRDGSNMSGIKVDVLGVSADDARLTIHLGALGAERFLGLIRGRTNHGRSFFVDGPEHSIAVQPGPNTTWHAAEDRDVHLDLSAEDAASILGTVQPIAGHYEIGAEQRLLFDIEQTIVRDANQNEIGRLG